jgi:hypothetical protein
MDDARIWAKIKENIGKEGLSSLKYVGTRKAPAELQLFDFQNSFSDKKEIALVDNTVGLNQRHQLETRDDSFGNTITINSLLVGKNMNYPDTSSGLELSSVDEDCEYNFKVICPKLNLLFNEVPKNYSSTVKTVIFSIEDQGRMNKDYHRFVSHRVWQSAFPEMMVDWNSCPWQSYFRFAFLRNPFARILSGYLNSGWNFYYQDLSFRDFVNQLPDKLELPNSDLINIHLKPFGNFVPRINGEFYLDFLGKTESFEEDFNEILYSSGIKNVLSFPTINRSEHEGYQNYYDSGTQKIVGKLYEEEIELGKYLF